MSRGLCWWGVSWALGRFVDCKLLCDCSAVTVQLGGGRGLSPADFTQGRGGLGPGRALTAPHRHCGYSKAFQDSDEEKMHYQSGQGECRASPAPGPQPDSAHRRGRALETGARATQGADPGRQCCSPLLAQGPLEDTGDLSPGKCTDVCICVLCV